jgi:hypothetical protein
MIIGYSNDSGYDCFGSSLASLLQIQGDEDMAKHVWLHYEKHPLVKWNGLFFTDIPKLVRTITFNQYQGRLNVSSKSLDDVRRDLFSKKDALKLSKLEQSVIEGNIRDFNGRRIPIPSIVLTKNGKDGHSVVMLDHYLCINDGKPQTYEELGKPVVYGYVQVEKQ